jgi:RND family efflux transporter MFP subunit
MNKITYVTWLVGLSYGLTSCKHGDPAKNPADIPIPVNLIKVEQQHLIYYDTYPASVVALKEVELRCEVGGDVTGMNFSEGQPVRQGQKLYEIDRSRYLASFQQAKANLDIAQSNVERTQRDADRYIELSKQDAIAKQRLDNALTDLQNAKSQVAAAKADLVKAETELNYSIISAPFDGTIGISRVRMGTLVTPDQTLLNVVSSDDPMGVDFVIDEKELGRFQKFEQKSFALTDSSFRIMLPDNALYPVNGKLSIIDRAVDPQTGTIKVRLSFANPGRKLKPGMSCSVKVLNENSGSLVLVPYRTVVEQMGEYFVYKIDSLKAKQIKIAIGAKIGPNIIVRNGLNPGDDIVIDGVQRLHDGSSVALGMKK